MKNCIAFIIMFICSYHISIGQDYKIEWSESLSDKYKRYRLVDMDDSHYYVMAERNYKGYLKTYDFNHQLVHTQTLSMTYEGVNVRFNKTITTSSGKYLYFSGWDNKKKKWFILKTPFKDGKTTPFFEKVHEHKYAVEFNNSATRFSNYDYSNDMVISRDKNYVGYINATSSTDKGNGEELAIAVFDNQMNLTWSKVVHFDFKDKAQDVLQVVVDNQGSVYVLTKFNKYADRNTTRTEKIADVHRVYKLTKDKREAFDINIGDDYKVGNAALCFPTGETTDFVVTGFYENKVKDKKDKKATRQYDGIFYATSSNNTLKNIKINSFEEERKKANYFRMSNLLYYEDGSIGFSAERVLGGDSYLSKDILVGRLSREGNLGYLKHIGKFMGSDYLPEACRAKVFLQNGKTYLVYNEIIPRKKQFTKFIEIDSKTGKIITNITIWDEKMRRKMKTLRPFLCDGINGKLLLGYSTIESSSYQYTFGIVNLNQ